MYWSLRRDQLCDPHLCEKAPDGARCDECPLTKIDEAGESAEGQLLRRTLLLRAAMRAGLQVALDDLAADEMYALLILDEEWERLERERTPHG